MPHFETPRETRVRNGILILIGLFLGFGNTAFAQDKQVKKEPIKQTVPLSGAGMFKTTVRCVTARTRRETGQQRRR